MALGLDHPKVLIDHHYLAIGLSQISVDHENEYLLSYPTLTQSGDASLMVLLREQHSLNQTYPNE